MDNKIKNNLRKGQVAIIVMLVSALMITLGLSLSKKTTVETKIDYNEEALKKAFNAAESGIDYYLATGTTEYKSEDYLSQANVVKENIGGDSGGKLYFNEFTPANGVQYLWLVDHKADGSLGTGYFNNDRITVVHEWPTNDDAKLGSLEISIFYNNGVGVKRYGYNFSSDAVNRQVTGFNPQIGLANVTIVGLNSLPNKILMTITPIFSGATLWVNGNGDTFPIQGERINSTGSAGVIFGGGDESSKINKKLTIERRYKFPYFLLSGIVSENSVLSR